jgi:pyridoxal 5'-phosphate synthase pdxT subunit
LSQPINYAAGTIQNDYSGLTVGVMALQGAFREHVAAVRKCGAKAIGIKFPEQLEAIDGLIIPGGESTTIVKLMDKYCFKPALQKFVKSGKPVFGTCAGLILLAKKVRDFDFGLGYIDITVDRNAYGRQVDSFEQKIEIRLEEDIRNSKQFDAVFIRAPIITDAGKNVQVLSELNGYVILARENNVLVSTFHPELTGNLSIHSYFLDMIKEQIKNRKYD